MQSNNKNAFFLVKSWKSKLPLSHRLPLSYHEQGIWNQSPLGVFVPNALFVPHTQPFRLVLTQLLQSLHVRLCKQASKVESIHLESGRCWINQQDAEWDWLRGYDVTLWFETLMTGSGLEESSSWKRGWSSIVYIRWGTLEIHNQYSREWMFQCVQKHLRAHSDLLKAIMREDANLIYHLGSNKPIASGLFC